MTPRKNNYNKDFRDRILKEITESNKSSSEIAKEFGLDPALLRQWKYRYLDFKEKSQGNPISKEDYEKLHKELDEVKVEKKILMRTLERLIKEN